MFHICVCAFSFSFSFSLLFRFLLFQTRCRFFLLTVILSSRSLNVLYCSPYLDKISLTRSDKGCSCSSTSFSFFAYWFAMIYFTYFLKSAIRYLTMAVKSVYVTQNELKGSGEIFVVSVEVVGPEILFVEGDMTRNIYFQQVHSFRNSEFFRQADPPWRNIQVISRKSSQL